MGVMPMQRGTIPHFDRAVCELLLGTDAVNVVVISDRGPRGLDRRRNRKQHRRARAVNGRDERGLVSLQQKMCAVCGYSSRNTVLDMAASSWLADRAERPSTEGLGRVYRRYPNPRPSFKACCRRAPTVRFMDCEILATGVLFFECAFNSR